MLSPYIGITGFMSRLEVLQVLDTVPKDAKRKLMVGVLASSKTIAGIPNKWPRRYPKPKKIAEIFIDHPSVINLIHFNTKEPSALIGQMAMATVLGGPNLHGFQLNIKWPDIDDLKYYRNRHPNQIIVLQCGVGALESVQWNPEKLAAEVEKYYGIVDYVLVDPSGGFGQPIEAEAIRDYLRGLHFIINRDTYEFRDGELVLTEKREMNFGVAGGFSVETLYRIPHDVFRYYPTTSIYAEGRLRDANDDLDIDKARAYVAKAYQMFGVN
jgi:hypothetical protein